MRLLAWRTLALFALSLTASALLLTASLSLADAGGGYHLVKTYPYGPAESATSEYFDYITVDAAPRRVYLGRGTEVQVIDARTEHVVKTIALGGAPEFAVADGRGMVYANLASANQIVAIDTRTMTIKSRWTSAPAGEPTAMAVDPVHRRLFSAGRNPAMLDIIDIDIDTGKVIQSFPISDGVDAARYDPATRDVFVSTSTGRLHIFHEDSPNSFTALPVVTTEMGAKTMGLDLTTHNVFVDTADFTPPPSGATGRARRPRAVLGTYRVLVYGG